MDAECKTLWMGDIQMHWDEAFICSLFAATGEQPVVKLIRDKVTGYPAGYGFLEFPTQRGAQLVLETYNGQVIPNTMHRFRMNWGAGGRRIETGDDHSIFVGDLAPDVSDDLLLSTFSSRFSSVRGAKVVIDPVTRMSKGFGFVRFGIKEEAEQALQTMNGVYCSSRPMRVSVATDRNGKPRGSQGSYGSGMGGMGGMGNTEEEGANTTVFVGGLDPSTTEEELRARFGAIGDIVSVKVPPGRGCGFVQYTTKDAAEAAISQMNGTVIGGVKVRCAWGRSAAVRAAAASGGAGGYYQQYPNYQQAGYQNYYGYQGYYPQYQQAGGYGGGYAGYGGGYDQQGSQQQGGFQHQGHGRHGGHHGHHRHQEPRDFTRPDDVESMNRHYASQRAYQCSMYYLCIYQSSAYASCHEWIVFADVLGSDERHCDGWIYVKRVGSGQDVMVKSNSYSGRWRPTKFTVTHNTRAHEVEQLGNEPSTSGTGECKRRHKQNRVHCVFTERRRLMRRGMNGWKARGACTSESKTEAHADGKFSGLLPFNLKPHMEDDDSSDEERSAPGPGPVGGAPKRAVADDSAHSYSLLLVGNLLDFGQDADTSHIREVPIQVDSQITQVSCGLDWILLLTASGRAYSCGLNAYGQLGQGHSQKQQQQLPRTNLVTLVPKPLLFPADRKIVRISCGASHGGFVVENGMLFMFGCSSYGRLGIGDTSSTSQHTSTQVRMTWSMLQAKVAATKASVSCGIPVIHQNLKLSVEPSSAVSATSSTIVAPQVPDTEENQEDGDNDDSVGDEVVFADISCGDRHTLVLGARASSISSTSSNMNLIKNSVIAFGDGMNGRLGIGSENDQLTGALITVFKGAPQYSKGGGGGLQPKITSISAGVSHNVALSSSGELFTWGNGADGQLGHGSCESEWVPRQVDFFKSISLASVKCGARHTIAVTRMGAVYTWGRGAEGQLGTGLAGLRDPRNGWKPEKVHLVIDPLAIQQMNIDAQVQAAFAASNCGDPSSGAGLRGSSASQQQLLQQDFRVAVRSIVAKANVCMALDEHARLFTWGCNQDRQLGFPVISADEKQLQSRSGPKRLPKEDTCPLNVDTFHTTTSTSSSWIVPKPKQLLYMDLHKPASKQPTNGGAFSSSLRVTTIRDQVHAMSVTTAKGFSRQSLVHVDASERFSLLVFKTEPKLAGGLRGAPSRTNSILGSGGGSDSGSLTEEGSSSTMAANVEYENGNPAAALSFPNRSQMQLLVHQQQQRQQSKAKDFEPVAREGITTRDGLDSKKSTKWHFSLLQELRSEDVPSRAREYYNLMASYKVHIRQQHTPGRASRTTTASASTEHSSARHLLGFEECDYDISGLSSLSNNHNNHPGEEKHFQGSKNEFGGRRDSSQRVVMARRATSANSSSRTPQAHYRVDTTSTSTTAMNASCPTSGASPPRQVRGFDDWLKTRLPQVSPKKQYAFGNAPRFQEQASNSSSAKEDEERSPVPVSAAKANRIASPKLQAKPKNGYNPANSEAPGELPLRPKSAFGRTLHTTFSTRKMIFTSGSIVPATSNNSNASPQQQSTDNNDRVKPTRAAPIPATPVKANAPAVAPPQRPNTVRAASANARSQNRASLKLQLHQPLSKSRFGPEFPNNRGFSAAFGSASTPLHPETSTPLVYPTSPRFSMGSGEDYSLVVARRLARERGGTPGPGTYDCHGG